MSPSKDHEVTAQMVNEIHRRSKKPTSEQELERILVPKFAGRAYHLPGNNVRQDWVQYMLNNHPLFGIFCHHRLHPIKTRQRLIILLGSFAFGVAITNAIYLWFVGSGRDDQQEVFTLKLLSTDSHNEERSDSPSYSVKSGVLVLLTVGSGSHALFDRFVWSLTACACCNAGGRFENCCFKNFGFYAVTLIVLAVLACASCVVVVRASMEEGDSTIPLLQNRTKEAWGDVLDFSLHEIDVQDVSFLKGYALEFVTSLFLYYPLFETMFFSGILGCYRVPILGGRPYSMRQEAKQMQSESLACPTESSSV